MSKKSKKIKTLSSTDYEDYLNSLLLGENAEIPDINKE